MRTVITGWPKTGKTTLANSLDVEVKHTDDLIDKMEWSEASQYVADSWFADSTFCVEGVAAVRALRKWLAQHPDGKPCDKVVWMDEPKVAMTKGQETMAKGCSKVWHEIERELIMRGVKVLSENAFRMTHGTRAALTGSLEPIQVDAPPCSHCGTIMLRRTTDAPNKYRCLNCVTCVNCDGLIDEDDETGNGGHEEWCPEATGEVIR